MKLREGDGEYGYDLGIEELGATPAEAASWFVRNRGMGPAEAVDFYNEERRRHGLAKVKFRWKVHLTTGNSRYHGYATAVSGKEAVTAVVKRQNAGRVPLRPELAAALGVEGAAEPVLEGSLDSNRILNRDMDRLQMMLERQKPRRRFSRVLSESQYKRPASGDTAMYDLYALVALSWEEGSGHEQYGYQPVAFGHSRKALIDRTFEESLYAMAEALVKDIRRAVADEIEYLFDPYIVDPKLVVAWLADNQQYARRVMEVGQKWSEGATDMTPLWWYRFSYGDTEEILNAPFWKNEKADQFGGRTWADIVHHVRVLDAMLRRDAPNRDVMTQVDRIFDLEHNTGMLIEKLPRNVGVTRAALDARSAFRSVKEFLPHVSDAVRHLIRP